MGYHDTSFLFLKVNFLGYPKTKVMSAKEDLFVQEYLITLNASDAYRKAGYKGKSVNQLANKLLTKPHIAAAINVAMNERAKRLEIDSDWVLKRLSLIATANPNEISRVQVGSCRYCNGTDHEYQWRTESEFERAKEKYWELDDNKKAKKSAPVIAGGFGYSAHNIPNPDCPHCDGYGVPRVVLGDTTRLSEEGTALYAGVKETKSGIEVKSGDQMKAIEMIARHVGFYEKDNKQTGNALAEALAEIQRRTSKAPIRRDIPEGDEQ